jgi:uncharacterized C2H2 Zn-finger protein
MGALDAKMPHPGLSKYPTVVRNLQGQWVELACPRCGANGSDGRFFEGKRGISIHMRTAHNAVGPAGISRTLSDEDIADLQLGKTAIQKKAYKAPLASIIDSRHIEHCGNNTYLRHCGCIALDPHGQWVELACYYCGANSASKSNGRPGFLSGFVGMRAHILRNHKSELEGKDVGALIWEECAVRRLTHASIQNLITGKSGIEVKTGDNVSLAAARKASISENINDDKNSGRASNEYKGHDYLVPFPTIVMRADRKWVEIRCYICDGNYLPGRKRFLKGSLGLIRHINKAHRFRGAAGGQKCSLDWAVNRCTHREVPKEEIDLIIDDKRRPSDYVIPEMPVRTDKQLVAERSAKKAAGRNTTQSAHKSTCKQKRVESPQHRRTRQSDSDGTDSVYWSADSVIPPPKTKKRLRGGSENGWVRICTERLLC